MFIQIDGIYYPNKGDQLMLHAINSILRKKNAILVYGRGKTYADPFDLRENRIFQLSFLSRFKIRFDKIISEKYLFSLGLVNERKIDVILDAGGFQYGDQWTEMYSKKYLIKLSTYLKRRKNLGQKIILMPQAFGPFEKKISKKIITTVFQYADLIYARDEQSYQYIIRVVGVNEKVRIAPDFTVLLSPDKLNEKYIKIAKNAIIIIPNIKMITHTSPIISNKYIDFIVKILRTLEQKKQKVILINHEGDNDLELINKIKLEAKSQAEIIDLNAKKTKAIIAEAKLVITSRYHGLMSALSQNVPSFTTSWSHKYREIMKFYGLEDYILSPEDINKSVEKICEFIDNPSSYPFEKHNIALIKHKQEVLKMWDDIYNLIEK